MRSSKRNLDNVKQQGAEHAYVRVSRKAYMFMTLLTALSAMGIALCPDAF